MNYISQKTYNALKKLRKNGESLDSVISRLISRGLGNKIPDDARDKIKKFLSLEKSPSYTQICEQVTYIKNGETRHPTIGTVSNIKKEMTR